MQVIYDDASNIRLTAQKRLIRVVYGQTQATPYACYLDPSLRNSTTGAIEVPGKEATKPVKRSVAVYTLRNSIVPGTVLVKTEGEYVTCHGGNKEERPFGLLGQWVGGTFDNLKGTNAVSAWLGFDATIDLIKPAFNTENAASEGISTVLTSAATALEKAEELKGRAVAVPATNSLLEVVSEETAKTNKQFIVADVVELLNENVLRLKLRI